MQRPQPNIGEYDEAVWTRWNPRYVCFANWLRWPTHGRVAKITSNVDELSTKPHFESVAWTIANRLASVYDEMIEYMRSKYETFMQFLSMPDVIFNNDNNTVVVDCHYFQSTIQVIGDECEMETEFRTSGFKYYSICESVYGEKQAAILDFIPPTPRARNPHIEFWTLERRPRIWDWRVGCVKDIVPSSNELMYVICIRLMNFLGPHLSCSQHNHCGNVSMVVVQAINENFVFRKIQTPLLYACSHYIASSLPYQLLGHILHI